MSLGLYDIVGYTGAFLILFGFYRTSIGKWTNKSLLYELDNFVGAACLLVYNIHNATYVGVLVNIVWLGVAVRGMSSFADRYSKNAIKKYKKTIRRR